MHHETPSGAAIVSVTVSPARKTPLPRRTKFKAGLLDKAGRAQAHRETRLWKYLVDTSPKTPQCSACGLSLSRFALETIGSEIDFTVGCRDMSHVLYGTTVVRSITPPFSRRGHLLIVNLNEGFALGSQSRPSDLNPNPDTNPNLKALISAWMLCFEIISYSI